MNLLHSARKTRFAIVMMVLAALGGCNVNGVLGGDDPSSGAGGAGGTAGQGGAPTVTTGVGPGVTGASTGATTGASTGASTGATTSGASSSTGMGATCAPLCGANQYCEGATLSCVCNPGFIQQGGACTAAPAGDPTMHTQEDVCDHWKAGHVVTEPDPLTSSGADCDAGSLKQAAIVDTLTRINMFRWMAGLGPTSDSAAYNADAQKCANLESWWPWTGGNPHSPPSSSKCYTPEGGATAGQSNIAWGSGHPAQAIDQFMEDNGNETTMGHRRWILNPPLGPIGIGYWEGGGKYGNAECLRVFGSSGGGPKPTWVSIPTAGFAPLTTASWTWTFHGSLGGIANATVSMLRVDDNMPLPVTMMKLSQGY
ncbi:MAG: CAP domain-containing protein, partial [Byssovorax sp.]